MLPSVHTLLGFSASDPAIADTGAQGVMGLPFGLLGGASDPTSPPPPPPPPPSTEENRGGFLPQYAKGERRKRGLEWNKPRDDLLQRLTRAYAVATGEAPAVVQQAAVAAVKPHAASSDGAAPPTDAVDWPAVMRDDRAVEALLRIYEQQIEEDNAALLLVLFQ